MSSEVISIEEAVQRAEIALENYSMTHCTQVQNMLNQHKLFMQGNQVAVLAKIKLAVVDGGITSEEAIHIAKLLRENTESLNKVMLYLEQDVAMIEGSRQAKH